MRELTAYKKTMEELPAGCRFASAQAEKEILLKVTCTEGRALEMQQAETTEIYVTAADEKEGMVYTQSASEDPRHVLAQALENSALSTKPGHSPALTGEASAIQELPDETTQTPTQLRDTALALNRSLEAAAKEPVLVQFSERIRISGIVNSLGLAETAAVHFTDADISTGSGFAWFESRPQGLPLDPAPVLAALEEYAAFQALPEIAPESGDFPAVLSSDAMSCIFLTGWLLFSGLRAKAGSTPLAGKTGEQIFGSALTIYDDPLASASPYKALCGYAKKIDAEGVRPQPLTLVKDGVLCQYLHNLSSADDPAMAGRAGRKTLLSGNIHTDVAVMPTNFILQEGTASLNELFAQIGDGVYILEAYDQYHGLNAASGDFAFPCVGVKIKDGRPVGRMPGLTMSGNLPELLSTITAVGKDRRFRPLDMYNSYTVSVVPAAFSRLHISG